MSVKGDFSKLARIRERLSKAPELAPVVAQRVASDAKGRAQFTAEGGSVRITVRPAAGPLRRRRSSFWQHGFVLAKGFMPPQWMAQIKRAADAVLTSVMGGR